MKRVVLCVLAVAIAGAPAAAASPHKRRARLAAFADCGQLVRYAVRHEDSYKAGGPPGGLQPMPVPVAAPGAAAGSGPETAPAPAADTGADSGGDFSLTNNQEAGVYEPDIVKTDGSTLYALTSGGTLEVVDVRGEPKLLGSLTIGEGYGHQMLFDKRSQQLLVMWSDYQGATSLAYVDISDPAHPVLKRSLAVDGTIVSARRTDSTVRVVLALRPPEFVQPAQTNEDRPAAWLPRATFRSATGHTSQRRLLGCRSVRHARLFSGLEQLTVLTIDFDKGLDPVDADSVMSGAETVYASADNLYVATQRYREQLEQRTDGPVPSTVTTQVHRFSLDDADNTTYRGSAVVPGFALDQFALSEYGGVLRIATTDTPPWFEAGAGDRSQSYVTTLAPDGDRLDQVGQVGGIGEGERIYAVRFLGDEGYVVTFRQTDPLFTLDLSDPAAPKVVGELEIPGVSTYLHPIAGDRLIGVGSGRDASTGESGLQVSLFDVSDLAAPKLEQRVTFANGSSEVEYDHHAFLWWQPRELAVLPVTTYEASGTTPSCPPGAECVVAPGYVQPRSAAVGLTVRPAGITEAGRAEHDAAVVRRSVIIGDRVITVSDAGVQASKLDAGWADAGFAAFTDAAGSATPPSR